jgi:membrane associated rhomboid family serine protease
MTLIIIVITALVSILAFQKHDVFYKLQFNPYNVKHSNEWYRFFSHALLHADWMHLFFNMLVLYFFGSRVEVFYDYYFEEKSVLYFLLLYIGGIIFAVLPTYRKHHNDVYYNSVGASGAVSAVLFSSVLLNPVTPICLWGVLCFPGIVWALIYLGYSYYMGKKGQDNINHDAHFWGAVFGIVFTIAIRPAFALEFIYRLQEFFN